METRQSRQKLAKEVQRLARNANRRLDRLEANNLRGTPAYTSWENSGSIKFGNTRGKSYQELQSEYWRVTNFLSLATSTVKGAKEQLHKIEQLVGIGEKIVSPNELRAYFALVSKIADYYNAIGQTAKSLDYQALWSEVNVMIENNIAQLDESVNDGLDIGMAIGRLNGILEIEKMVKGMNLDMEI